jgi:peroxiredoxin
MLPLGTRAPRFSLPDRKGEPVSLEVFADARALLVIFMCNHCPYVKYVREALVKLVREYQAKGVAVVGISSNDVSAYPEDGPDEMAEEARRYGYTFPYLYDETQEVARAYRAAWYTGVRWTTAGRSRAESRTARLPSCGCVGPGMS